jgi:hypothetical protein
MNDYRQTLIDIALRYVGTEEQPLGSNRGFLIDRWNAQVNAPIGSFWCCSFVSSMGMELETKCGIDWPLPFSADCDVVYWAAKRKLVLSKSGSPGDLVVCHRNDDAFHIGIVGNRDENGTLQSIEGNSNNDGSRNGIKVALRSNVMAGRNPVNVSFIKWSRLIDDNASKILVNDKAVDPIFEYGKLYLPLRKSLEALHGVLLTTQNLKSTADGSAWNGEPIPYGMITRNGSRYIRMSDFITHFKLKSVTSDTAVKLYPL